MFLAGDRLKICITLIHTAKNMTLRPIVDDIMPIHYLTRIHDSMIFHAVEKMRIIFFEK